MLRRTALLSLIAALTSGCVSESTDEGTPVPRHADGPLTGRAIEVALEPGALDKGAIDALAKHIEVTTGAESIRISVRESDDDGTMVVVESWGRTPITDDALVASLRAEFPAVKNAMIAVKALEGEGPSGTMAEIDVDHDEDPEQVRKRVLEKLRADGVQGDVQVHVDDDDEGRREVRVEVEQKRHP